MKFLSLILLLLGSAAASALTFTEFYVQTTGSNLNAGSTTANAATYTAVNGNWDGTSIYTPVDGSTPASTVNVGDWASIYLDAATVAVYVGRITAVAGGVNGAITISTTAKGGAAPTTGATGRSIKVGGAWKGPNAGVTFPWAFMVGTMVDANTNMTRVNIKGGVTYSVTTTLSTSLNGPMKVQGYTTTPGDGGKATFDGGTSGSAYILAQQTGSNTDWEDLIYQHNGATSASIGLNLTGVGINNVYRRIVVNNILGVGIAAAESLNTFVECEVYQCSTRGMDYTGVSTVFNRCIFHDNTASGVSITSTADATFLNCIFDSNGAAGSTDATVRKTSYIGCDFYNNTTDGLAFTGGANDSLYIANCNFVKNGGWGINSPGSLIRSGYVINCGFGTGSQINTSGSVAPTARVDQIGTLAYPTGLTPWFAPATGNFSISLLNARNTGRGKFTQTQAAYTGTVGYPDVGAAQHYAPIAGGNYTWAQ